MSGNPVSGQNPTYIFSKNVKDPQQLRQYLYSQAYNVFDHMVFDPTSNSVIFTSNEDGFNQDTYNAINKFLKNYPDPPQEGKVNPTGLPNIQSAYIPYSVSSITDGDQTITSNVSLARNMYYNNLTINAGAILNTNGWRIIVSKTLIINGSIRFNGGHAFNGVKVSLL